MSVNTKTHFIEIDIPAEDEMENLFFRVQNFNDCNSNSQYLSPCKNERNNAKLLFLYLKKQSVKNSRSSLAEVFSEKVALKPIDIANLSSYESKVIASAKKIMIQNHNHHYNGEANIKWTNKSCEDILRDIEDIVGFSDFKAATKKICNYVKNTNTNVKTNHNIVLINKCDGDVEFLISHIYNLYLSMGVIVDPIFEEGDLGDAANISRDTRYLYYIYEEWGEDQDRMFTSATDKQRYLNRIRKRDTIYITVMNEVQYEKLREDDSFISLFPFTIYLDDITKAEKIEFLKRELSKYGFKIDAKGFETLPMLDYSIEKIKAEIAIIAHKRLTNEKCKFLLNINDFSTKIKKTTNGKTGFDELEELIGLDSVKSTIREIATFLENRGKDALPCLHMVFRGNPGTGKTTVARIIGRIFHEIGLLKYADRFVEAERVKLVSQYLGGTATKTAQIIKSAMGGVLFIDEAYALCNGEKYDYGVEAVNTLVKQMEDYRKDFVCIMAGYTKEMDEMLNMNPGLKDRVQFYIDFPDYNANELTEIFANLCAENKYKLKDDAKTLICDSFEKIIATNSKNFANGRIARKIFERIKLKQAMRSKGNNIIKKDVQATFSEKDLAVLLCSDNNKKVIGF